MSAPTPAELAALPADRRLELLELQRQRRDRDRDRADAADDRRRQSMHQWINSGVLLIGAVLAGGSLLATAATLRTGQDELNTAKEGQVTDRYTKATEQLASSKREVRTAAVYALERIAADSHRDRPTIRDVLAAYVREHDPAPTIKSADLPAGPDTDVAAALSVLTRCPPGRSASLRNPRAADFSLDLHEIRVPGTRFPVNADLSNTDLFAAVLPSSDLSYADLSRASMVMADVSGSDLSNANLTRAYLTEAKMPSARLRNANLNGATLRNAKLNGADLTGADLSGADLSGANLSGATLIGAKGTTEAEIRRYAKVDGDTTFE
ncbi:pentapeptide repeat-containing protein [Actinomadura sp. GTD37]|uniref:pentapeptide repeat-containing protein n=1 Tax=Actinomadura sp. GTD37 TaxID=1778030 RepID=UPI0035BEF312